MKKAEVAIRRRWCDWRLLRRERETATAREERENRRSYVHAHTRERERERDKERDRQRCIPAHWLCVDHAVFDDCDYARTKTRGNKRAMRSCRRLDQLRFACDRRTLARVVMRRAPVGPQTGRSTYVAALALASSHLFQQTNRCVNGMSPARIPLDFKGAFADRRR